MGDLGVDTAVRQVDDDTFSAEVSPDWEIWGPMGGYIASIGLRAAGAAGPADRGLRPAAFSCHYLGVAAFAPVQIAVHERRAGRSAVAQRVEISQDGRSVLDAMVWSVGPTDGLEHDHATAPDVPGPDGLPTVRDLVGPDAEPPFRFWENFEARPLDFVHPWPPEGPLPPRWREWLRFLPTATFADPWIDAARSTILVDLPSWPAGHRPHAWQEPPFIAPTLDLQVSFHQPADDEPWLLCDGDALLSTGGLLPWRSRVWTTDGRLVASGGGQCLYRRMRG